MNRRPLRIAVAPDSFKGTLSAAQAASAISEGLSRSMPPGSVFLQVPMADGGEGTVDAWLAATGAERVLCDAEDPLGRPLRAAYGWRAQDATAVLELAAASGLPLLRPEERDPGIASTFGTGLVLRDALARGARRIVLGLGGSATTDGGAGLVQALGVRLADADGAPVGRGGLALARVATVDPAPARALLAGVRLEAACDVDNPLCGPNGAAAVYGPQKCSPEVQSDPARLSALLGALDGALGALARATAAATGRDFAGSPGAGAAGGTGFAVLALLGGRLTSGARLIASAARLAERVLSCDWVVTGEGRIDGQTLHGKTPSAVAETASAAGVPVAYVCGQAAPDAGDLGGAPLRAASEDGRVPATSEEAAARLADAAERLGRDLLAAKA